MQITGGCHCGAIRYQAEIEDPHRVSVCHCTDCQTLTGSPFRTSIARRNRLPWINEIPACPEVETDG